MYSVQQSGQYTIYRWSCAVVSLQESLQPWFCPRAFLRSRLAVGWASFHAHAHTNSPLHATMHARSQYSNQSWVTGYIAADIASCVLLLYGHFLVQTIVYSVYSYQSVTVTYYPAAILRNVSFYINSICSCHLVHVIFYYDIAQCFVLNTFCINVNIKLVMLHAAIQQSQIIFKQKSLFKHIILMFCTSFLNSSSVKIYKKNCDSGPTGYFGWFHNNPSMFLFSCCLPLLNC